MTIVIPQPFAQVTEVLQWANDPEHMVVTYGLEVDSGAPPADATAIATAAGAIFDAEVMPLVSTSITHLGTDVVWQDAALPAPPTLGFAASAQAGGAAGSLVPQNTAFLIHKRTAVGGRGGRGRMYIPGVQEGNVSDIGVVAGATVAAWNTALSDWLAAILAHANLTSMVVLHNSPGAHAADSPHPVTSLVLDSIVSTQRRRLRR